MAFASLSVKRNFNQRFLNLKFNIRLTTREMSTGSIPYKPPENRSIYASSYPSQHGLEWNRDLINVVPRWIRTPDPNIVLSLAKPHLPSEVEYTVSEFAAGVFNKLYLLSPPGVDSSIPHTCTSGAGDIGQCYVMRVSLPVDPHFKTASEVATLHYLANHTSVPVPLVIAYCSSADNPLGFEWILGTRVPGVPLREFWDPQEIHCNENDEEDTGGLYSANGHQNNKNTEKKNKLTWKEKVSIVDTLVRYIKQMHGLKLDHMGSLYLAGEVHPHLHWLYPSTSSPASSPPPIFPEPKDIRTPDSLCATYKNHPPNLASRPPAPPPPHTKPHPPFTPIPYLPGYALGPTVALPFFYHRRLKLHLDRGPFASSAEWVRAYLDVQIGAAEDKIKGVMNGSVDLDGEGKEKAVEELKGSIRAAKALIPLILRFFGESDADEYFVLNHLDLSTSNILIDPLTHQITGIVDWEYVSLQPKWKARQPLKFLRGPEINPVWYAREVGGEVPSDWERVPKVVMNGVGAGNEVQKPTKRATLPISAMREPAENNPNISPPAHRHLHFPTPLPQAHLPTSPLRLSSSSSFLPQPQAHPHPELLPNLQNQLLRLACEHIIPSGGQAEKEMRIFEYKIAQTHVDKERKWVKVLQWAERVSEGGNVERDAGEEERWFEPEVFC